MRMSTFVLSLQLKCVHVLSKSNQKSELSKSSVGFIYEKYCNLDLDQSSISKNKLFIDACKNGLIYLAFELMDTVDQETFINAFGRACVGGHLEMVKFLWSVKGEYKVSLLDSFKNVCTFNRLALAKWLWELNEPELLNHDHLYILFVCACRRGFYDLAKWIWSISNIDHESKICAFKLACESGNNELVKWFIDVLNVDHCLGNHFAIRTSFLYNNVEMLKYLLKLDEII